MSKEEESQATIVAPKERLTDWKVEPSVQDLQADLEATKPSHSQTILKIQRWRDLMHITGSAKRKPIPNRSNVQPKLVRKQAEWRYPALSEPLLNNPKMFQVLPATFEDGPKARQAGLMLNHQFRNQMNRVRLVDEMVKALVDEGTLILQTGWERVTKMVKVLVPVWEMYPLQDEQELQLFQQMVEESQSDPRTFKENAEPAMQEAVAYFLETGEPVIAIQVGEEEVEQEEVLINRPTVDVLNPDNAYVDPSCNGDLDKALFVIHSHEVCYADLKKQSDLYQNLESVLWDSNGPVNVPEHSSETPTDFQFKDRARKKVTAYTYWGYYDIEGKGELTPIVATWIGNVLIRLQKSPFEDGKLPFVAAAYLPVKRRLHGETDAELLEDNQATIGAITRGLIDSFGRSANAQQGFAKGMLDPINRRRFDEGRDYEYNPGISPAMGLIEHKFPEIPQSAMLMLNLQNQEGESLTGTKSFAGGISGDAYGKVATGIRGALDASARREMAILRRLADAVRRMGLRILSMNAQFLAEEEVVRVTNQEFVKVTRDDMQGQFDLLVDINTAEMDAAKAQDLSFLMQTVGPNTDPKILMETMARICELKQMPDLAQSYRQWEPPQPSEMDQKKMELEIQALEAEVMLKQAQAKKAMADAMRAEAVAQATQVETHMEQSGVNHARDMELQQAQAAGNQELTVTKALVTPRKIDQTAPDVEAAIGFNALSGRSTTGQLGA